MLLSLKEIVGILNSYWDYSGLENKHFESRARSEGFEIILAIYGYYD